jgi:Fic family protein
LKETRRQNPSTLALRIGRDNRPSDMFIARLLHSARTGERLRWLGRKDSQLSFWGKPATAYPVSGLNGICIIRLACPTETSSPKTCGLDGAPAPAVHFSGEAVTLKVKLMTTHEWAFIEDLPEDWPRLRSNELETLASIWKDQSSSLQERDAFRQFNERLRREWAIETGIIEKLYSIERGITQLLIEKGIEASLIPHGATDKPVEKILPVLKDQEEVLEGLFDFVAGRRDLSNSYVKELHQALTRHQETVQGIDQLGQSVEVPLLRGEWKQLPNNPTRTDGSTHEYCPPVHVAAEMDRLIAMHREHIEKGVPPEVEAAWLHHRFTQIHPFHDGNGRIARSLASVVFLRSGWFPLVINRDHREEYISALETADRGDLAPLVGLFAGIQRKAFLGALSLSENVLKDVSPLQQMIAAATDRLRARKRSHVERMQSKAFELSRALEGFAEEKLQSIAASLNQELRGLGQGYFADAKSSDPETDFWFKKQIIDVARDLGYYADTRTYRAWVRLKIKEDRQSELVVSFHSLGVEFLGLMAVSAFIEYRDRSEDGETTVDGPHVLSKDVFQFSHREKEEDIRKRFEPWLADVLLIGLDEWRKQL